METRWLSVFRIHSAVIKSLLYDVMHWVCVCVYMWLLCSRPDNKTWFIISVWCLFSKCNIVVVFFIPDLMHTVIEQPVYKWRRTEQYGGGLAEWHHTEIIDYCPVTIAEEEKQIRLCVCVCVSVHNCGDTFWCIWLERAHYKEIQ